MQVVLVMFKSDGTRRSFSLTRDITVLGRREDCDLRIPLGEVSRKHCRIIKNGQDVRLEDLGSSNGTYLNGQRIQEVEIQPGDTVQIGPVTFVAQLDGMPADDQLQPHLPTESAVEPAEYAQAEESMPDNTRAASASGDSLGDLTAAPGHGGHDMSDSEAIAALEADDQAMSHLNANPDDSLTDMNQQT